MNFKYTGKKSDFLQNLSAYEIKTRHDLGQNFLWDTGLLQRIFQPYLAEPAPVCLEIGSGAGTLSQVLADKSPKVISVEVDTQLFPLLQDLSGEYANLFFQFTDARTLDLAELFTAPEKENLLIAGNLPYYITSELIAQCVTQLPQAKQMIFLVQKEVVSRLAGVAGDGKSQSKNQGWLTKLLACYGRVELGPVLGRDLFYPSPRVDSQIIIFTRLDGLPADFLTQYPNQLLKTIDMAFSQRRKTLVNCLSAYGFGPSVQTWLAENQLKATIRAEELAPADFVSLCKYLYDI